MNVTAAITASAMLLGSLYPDGGCCLAELAETIALPSQDVNAKGSRTAVETVSAARACCSGCCSGTLPPAKSSRDVALDADDCGSIHVSHVPCENSCQCCEADATPLLARTSLEELSQSTCCSSGIAVSVAPMAKPHRPPAALQRPRAAPRAVICVWLC